jgi:hypothetical protein
MEGVMRIFFRINQLLAVSSSSPPPPPPPWHLGEGGELKSLQKYCFTEWTGWILDIYISKFKKAQTLTGTIYLYFSVNINKILLRRIFVFDTHQTFFAV